MSRCHVGSPENQSLFFTDEGSPMLLLRATRQLSCGDQALALQGTAYAWYCSCCVD